MPTAGQVVRAGRLVAALERERRIRAQAGLLPQAARDLDVRTHGTKRRFALERARDRRVEPQARALVDVLRRQRRRRRFLAASRSRQRATAPERERRDSSTRFSLHTSLEIDGTAAGRAVPFDGDRPRAGHAELGGRAYIVPALPAGCTCTFPDMTMPGIVMFAATRTVPTSTRAPDEERNSIVKVLRPVLKRAGRATAATMSMSPDRTVWTTPPPAAVRPGVRSRPVA